MDALSPLFARLLPMAFGSADIVDGERAISSARMVKTPEEIEAIRASIAVAEAGLATVISALRPGMNRRALIGVFMEVDRIARHHDSGDADVVRISTLPGSGTKDTIAAGDLVALHAGVVAGGCTGEVVRTWVAGPDGAGRKSPRFTSAGTNFGNACSTPAARTRPVMRCGAPTKLPVNRCPPGPSCRSRARLGRAVVVRDLPATAAAQRLVPGAVVSVTAEVTDPDVGVVVGSEAVLITPNGPQVLTSSPRWKR